MVPSWGGSVRYQAGGGGSVRCRMVPSTENPLAEHEHFCEDSKTLEQNDAAFVKTTAMQRVSPISAQ